MDTIHCVQEDACMGQGAPEPGVSPQNGLIPPPLAVQLFAFLQISKPAFCPVRQCDHRLDLFSFLSPLSSVSPQLC